MASTVDKLANLLKTKEQLEADIQAENQAARRAEKERLAADRAAKEAVEMANRDATHYAQTTEMVNKILEAMGKRDPSPADAIVVSYLMLYARDAMQQHTPQGGVNAIASYFRGAALAKKAVKK